MKALKANNCRLGTIAINAASEMDGTVSLDARRLRLEFEVRV